MYFRFHLIMQVLCDRYRRFAMHPGDLQEHLRRFLCGRSYDSQESTWEGDLALLTELFVGIPFARRMAIFIANNQSSLLLDLEQHIEICAKNRLTIVSYDHDHYPHLLRHIPNPPYGMTLSTNPVSFFSRPCIAVVGSRKVSRQALLASEEIGFYLASCNYTIVSGGAYGVDIATHLGALDCPRQPLPACVVFAGDLQKLYPVGNQCVFNDLNEKGACFLSERISPSFTRPKDFPIRNRIISGLASHLIVVEANRESGAMLTAKAALEQGREVLVWKNSKNVFNEGNQQLIDDGAKTFHCPLELLEILQEDLRVPL